MDLSPHLGHKLIAAADLKFDYVGLILDPGDSIDGIAMMLLGLYEEKTIRSMSNPSRIQMVKRPKQKSKKGNQHKNPNLAQPQKKNLKEVKRRPQMLRMMMKKSKNKNIFTLLHLNLFCVLIRSSQNSIKRFIFSA